MPGDSEVKLQAYYTFSELAKLMEISRRRVERLCRNEGLITDRVGNRHVIWVSDIEEHLPAMFRSLLTCQRARHTQRVTMGLLEEKAAAEYDEALEREFARNERFNPH
jgi:hypothetical protein